MAYKTIGIHYPVMQLILVIVSFLCLCVKKAEKITKFQLYGIVYFCYQFYHIIRFFFYYLVGMIFNQAIPRRFCDENLSKKSQYILLRHYMEEKNMVSLVLPLWGAPTGNLSCRMERICERKQAQARRNLLV